MNDYAGKQEESTQVDPETKTVASFWSNVAAAEYEGVEIDVQILVNEYLRVFANYGTLDASYQGFVTDINEGDGVTKLEPADFLTPRFAPEESWGAGLSAYASHHLPSVAHSSCVIRRPVTTDGA